MRQEHWSRSAKAAHSSLSHSPSRTRRRHALTPVVSLGNRFRPGLAMDALHQLASLAANPNAISPTTHKRSTLLAIQKMTAPGPKRKLPKMNPSERAKYYRRRIREYMATLEVADEELALHVQSLEVLHDVQRQLRLIANTSRQRMLAHVWEFMDKRMYLEQHILSDPKLEIQDLQVSGDASGVVLRIDARISGVFSQDTIEKQLYTFVPGNTLLLDSLMRSQIAFQNSFRFFFDADGALVQRSSETDFATGLMESIGCPLRDIRRLLDAMGNPSVLHRVFDKSTLPPPPPAIEAGTALW